MRREIDEVRRSVRALQVALGDFLAAVDDLDRVVAIADLRDQRPPLTPYPAGALLTERQAADLLGLKPQTLANWRSAGRSPLRWMKPSGQVGQRGGRVRYRIEDVQAYLERTR